MTPIERAARALADVMFVKHTINCEMPKGPPRVSPIGWDVLSVIERTSAMEAARAVLQAIREPSEAMSSGAECADLTTSQGGEDSFDYLSKENAADVWRGMINAALAESA